MSREQVLEAAIKIALANGWKPDLGTGSEADQARYVKRHTMKLDLFDHDFARALWGYEVVWGCPEHGTGDNIFEEPDGPPGRYRCYECYSDAEVVVGDWQYHLMRMAIAEDRLQYLADHLPAEADSPAS